MPGRWGGKKAGEWGGFHLQLSAGTVVQWERSSLGMPPLALLLQRDQPRCPHYSDPQKSPSEVGLWALCCR